MDTATTKGGAATGSVLALVRHGESLWNEQGLFTGLVDVGLTFRGRAEAEESGCRLVRLGIVFDLAFTSILKRARESTEILLRVLSAPCVPIVSSPALNERDYGDLAGLDEKAAIARFGAEHVRAWRRGYAERPPCGESLMDVRSRLSGFYVGAMLPELVRGRSLLVVGHGNSLRAFVMELEGMSHKDVETLEIAPAEAFIYDVDTSGAARRRHGRVGTVT